MGLPSSLTATMPACFIAAISAKASPLLPTDAAPIGHTRALALVAARSTIPRVTEARSFTGCVFGMQLTAVNPPRAAARVPVSIVSEISPPGSRKWQCKSMNPGATTRPAASSISPRVSAPDDPAPPVPDRFAPTRAILPPSTSTSSVASVPLAGSITRPFLISSIRFFLRRVRRIRRRAPYQLVQQAHPHRQAVGHLFQDARLWPVRYRRVDLQAANHRPRMQHERVALGQPQPIFGE